MATDTLTSADTSRSIIEKGADAGSTAVRSDVQKRADTLRAKYDQEGFHPAVNYMLTSEPTDLGKLQRNIEKNYVKMDIDPDTGQAVLSSEQDKLKRQDENDARMNAKFDKEGYKGLSPADKDKARKMAESALKRLPGGDVILAEMDADPDKKEARLAEILEDPRVAKKFRALVEGVATADPIDTADIRRLIQTAEEKKNVEEDKKIAKENADRELDDARRLADSFDVSKNPDSDNLTKLALFKVEGSDIKIKARDAKIQVDALTKQMKLLEDQLVGGKGKLSNEQQKELNDKHREAMIAHGEQTKILETNNALLTEWQSLEQQQKNAPIVLREATTKADAATREFRKAQADHYTAAANRDEAKQDILTQEQEHQERQARLIEQAVKEFGADVFAEGEKLRKQLIEEQKAAAKTAEDKVLAEQFQKRWDEKGTTPFGRETVKPNKEKIKADMVVLLQDGPDKLIKDMLTKSMSEDEADRKMEDAEFMKTAREQVGEKLLARHLQRGKLNEAEATKIYNSEWGKNAITNAMKANSELRSMLTDSKGAIKRPEDIVGFLEKHKGAVGMSLATLLMILISPLAAAALGGVAVVGKLATEGYKQS